MRLLLIEDDADLVRALLPQLESAGYDADVCPDGGDAAYYLQNGGYGAVILDRMLPGKDGLTILRELRATGSAVPVLMLTALDSVRDRTQGLDAGADDYLVKPFAVPELLSRIRALLRRPPAVQENDTLCCGALRLCVRECTLSRGATSLTLSRKETALLELFFRHPGRVLSRAEILACVWGGDETVEDGNVDNYVYFIRRRLKAFDAPISLRAVHGVGYQLVEDAT